MMKTAADTITAIKRPSCSPSIILGSNSKSPSIILPIIQKMPIYRLSVICCDIAPTTKSTKWQREPQQEANVLLSTLVFMTIYKTHILLFIFKVTTEAFVLWKTRGNQIVWTHRIIAQFQVHCTRSSSSYKKLLRVHSALLDNVCNIYVTEYQPVVLTLR